MLYILVIIFGILTGLIAKGSIYNFLNINFNKKWLIITAFLLQTGSQFLSLNENFGYIKNFSYIITSLSFCLILLAIWFNRRYLGICLIGAGSLFNMFVMLSNGGRMPVSSKVFEFETVATKMLDTSKHMLLDSDTKLSFLSDIIVMPGFLGTGMKLVSVGDLIVVSGVFFVILEIVVGKGLLFPNQKKLQD